MYVAEKQLPIIWNRQLLRRLQLIRFNRRKRGTWNNSSHNLNEKSTHATYNSSKGIENVGHESNELTADQSATTRRSRSEEPMVPLIPGLPKTIEKVICY